MRYHQDRIDKHASSSYKRLLEALLYNFLDSEYLDMEDGQDTHEIIEGIMIKSLKEKDTMVFLGAVGVLIEKFDFDYEPIILDLVKDSPLKDVTLTVIERHKEQRVKDL